MPAVTDFWWVNGCVGSRWLSAGSEVVGLGWVGGYVSCVCVCVEVVVVVNKRLLNKSCHHFPAESVLGAITAKLSRETAHSQYTAQ